MLIVKGEKAWLIRFNDGEDLMERLKEIAEEEKLKGATLVSATGMLKEVEIAYFTGKEYISSKHEEALEVVSLQGNLSLKDGKPFYHIHCALAFPDHTVKGGHLVKAKVANTLELFIIPLDFPLVRKEVPGSPLLALERG